MNLLSRSYLPSCVSLEHTRAVRAAQAEKLTEGMHMDQALAILYIEPQDFDQVVVDDYVRKMTWLLNRARNNPDLAGSYFAGHGFAPYMSSRGQHLCACGAASSAQDYNIGTIDGTIVVTNYLAAHYLACHRSAVSRQVLDLLDRLDGELAEPTPELLQVPSS